MSENSTVEISTKRVTVTTGDLISAFGPTPKEAAAHVELLHADILRLRAKLDALDFDGPQSQTGG